MIPVECKIDDFGILYIDESYQLNDRVPYYDNYDGIKSLFFKFTSTDDYIIKYHLEKLNKKEVYQMLFKIYHIGGNTFTNVDFPIGYYKENSKIKGLIIPNYANSISMKEALLNDILDRYYYKSDDKKENIYLLLNDILKILEDLYNNGIIYTDVNPGNFIIYHNEVKIIDFDPKYIFYEDADCYYLKALLLNYMDLVKFACEKSGIDISGLKQFDSDFNNIKSLIKKK